LEPEISLLDEMAKDPALLSNEGFKDRKGWKDSLDSFGKIVKLRKGMEIAGASQELERAQQILESSVTQSQGNNLAHPPTPRAAIRLKEATLDASHAIGEAAEALQAFPEDFDMYLKQASKAANTAVKELSEAISGTVWILESW
jgi:hypothetical protein